jgi:predicted dienelactone hydrolase
MTRTFLFLALSFIVCAVNAQENRIDIIGPLAPELADFGSYEVGVQTIEVVAGNRVDILNTARGGETAYYDRKLTLEIWYPADFQGQEPGTQYQAITRNPEITATLYGRAVRGAQPQYQDGPYPLLIISHGYPGNRFLMSHTGENLASKGYVVVSIDHLESTYDNQQSFASTLYNRPLDQRFVLNTLASISSEEDQVLRGMIDAERTGVIGYSMGGYGLLNNLGAGYSEESVVGFLAPPNRLLEEHATSNPEFRNNLDLRIKAGFAIGPWGMNAGFWQSEDLAGIEVPTFYLAGDQDSVAGYENGAHAIFNGAKNSDRYLLTLLGAGHNAGAPMPVPNELDNVENEEAAGHYRDANWDNVEMNNIMDHFVTAWFDTHLKGMDRQSSLGLVPSGYEDRLTLEHLSPGQ